MLCVPLIYITRGKIESNNITPFVDDRKIVFVDVTADWCETCKFNKVMDLDIVSSIKLFQRKKLSQCKLALLSKVIKYISS